jgi:protocatechuate 3,4-dioxygenase beta subunit
MKVSSLAVAKAVTVLFVSLALSGSQARQAAPAAAQKTGRAKAPGVQHRDPPNRTLRTNGPFGPARRQRGPNDPEWTPGPVPETIAVSVSGQAADEAGKPVPRAHVFILSTGILEPKLVGQATADEEGRYQIEGRGIPVVREHPGKTPLPEEITPYADFVVCGTAPGRGLVWTPPQSMYALAEPHPDDIQGRLPLGQPVELLLTFPNAATLSGRVVDEDSRPVPGAKVQVSSAELLDAEGRETGNSLYNVWQALPGSIGFATTDDAGRFSIDRMPDRACLWISVRRRETDNTQTSFYAATIDGPETFHGPMPPGAWNGRMPHKVMTGDIVVTFPRIRRIAISVIGDDTQRPVADVGVFTLGDDLQTGMNSGGKSDRDGRLILGLPPGQYRGICADPPIESNYLRTYQRPLVVERGEGDQTYQLVLNSGCEIQVRVTEADTNKPVAKAFFWKSPVDDPDRVEHIPASTFWSGVLRTDESGLGRTVVRPEPGKRYRLRFAGIQHPNMPDQINREAARTQGYTADPAESRPIELVGGKTIRLWFRLSKAAR